MKHSFWAPGPHPWREGQRLNGAATHLVFSCTYIELVSQETSFTLIPVLEVLN